VYGDPREPSTAIRFGEKGAGKTAVSLQIARHLAAFNRDNPGQRLMVIHYDDFNPFLDRFRDRLGRFASGGPIACWPSGSCWDHMDAILSIGVTGLIDRLLEAKNPSPMVAVRRIAGGRGKSSTATRLATCCCCGVLRPIDGGHLQRSLARAAPQTEVLCVQGVVGFGVGIGWSVVWLIILIVSSPEGWSPNSRPSGSHWH